MASASDSAGTPKASGSAGTPKAVGGQPPKPRKKPKK